jgi:hypothetical protein
VIGKILQRKTFLGPLRYLLSKKKIENEGARIIATTLVNRTVSKMAWEMDRIASQRPNRQKPVYHLILSCRPEEGLAMTDEEWAEIIDKYARKMGFRHEQWAAIRHGDHVHIVVNRVRINGGVISDSQDWARSENAVRYIEELFNLERVPRSHLTARKRTITHVRARSQQEMALEKKGESSVRQKLQKPIAQALRGTKTFTDFVDKLHERGVEILPHESAGDIYGLSFFLRDDPEYEFSGTKLGHKFTWGNIKKKGLKYDAQRDREAVQRCQERCDSFRGENTSCGAAVPEGIKSDAGLDGGSGGFKGSGFSPLGIDDTKLRETNPNRFRKHGEPSSLTDPPKAISIGRSDAHPLPAAGSGAGLDGASGGSKGDRFSPLVTDNANLWETNPNRFRKPGEPGSLTDPPKANSIGGGDAHPLPVATAGAGLDGASGGPKGSGFSPLGIDGAKLRETNPNRFRKHGEPLSLTNTPPAPGTTAAASKQVVGQGHAVEQQGRGESAPDHVIVATGQPPGSTEQIRSLDQEAIDQIRAIGASSYTVKVIMPGSDKGHSHGPWTGEQVSERLNWLKEQNANGRDILICPADSDTSLLILDGISAAALVELKNRGLSPAVVLEVEPDRFEASLNFGSTSMTDEDREVVREELCDLSKADAKNSGFGIFGRLAGFWSYFSRVRDNNDKPSLVRLREATGQVVQKVRGVIARARKQTHSAITTESVLTPAPTKPKTPHMTRSRPPPSRPIPPPKPQIANPPPAAPPQQSVAPNPPVTPNPAQRPPPKEEHEI